MRDSDRNRRSEREGMVRHGAVPARRPQRPRRVGSGRHARRSAVTARYRHCMTLAWDPQGARMVFGRSSNGLSMDFSEWRDR